MKGRHGLCEDTIRLELCGQFDEEYNGVDDECFLWREGNEAHFVIYGDFSESQRSLYLVCQPYWRALMDRDLEKYDVDVLFESAGIEWEKFKKYMRKLSEERSGEDPLGGGGLVAAVSDQGVSVLSLDDEELLQKLELDRDKSRHIESHIDSGFSPGM